MTLLLHRLILDSTRCQHLTLPIASLLLLLPLGSGCDTAGSETSPATPDTETPSTPTPPPPPLPPPPPPDTPTGLRIVGEGATETHMFIDLEWDSVPDADFYRLEVDWDPRCRFFPDRLMDTFSHGGLRQLDLRGTDTDIEVSDTSHRAILARQQSDYCFRIRAERDSGDPSDWSTTVTGRTPEADANRTPDGIEGEAGEHGKSLGGYYHGFRWKPVAGAFGYLLQVDLFRARPPTYPLESSRAYWTSRASRFWDTSRALIGCTTYFRVCTLYDEKGYEAFARDNNVTFGEPESCSAWSDIQKYTIDVPEMLPSFQCRNAPN